MAKATLGGSSEPSTFIRQYEALYSQAVFDLRDLLLNEGEAALAKVAKKFLVHSYVNEAVVMGELEGLIHQTADCQAMKALSRI